jgi:hypothetical protein
MLKEKEIKELLWDDVIQPGTKYMKEILSKEKILKWAEDSCGPDKSLTPEAIETIQGEWELLVDDVYGYTHGRRSQPNFEDLVMFNEYIQAANFAEHDLDIYIVAARRIFDEVAKEAIRRNENDKKRTH